MQSLREVLTSDTASQNFRMAVLSFGWDLGSAGSRGQGGQTDGEYGRRPPNPTLRTPGLRSPGWTSCRTSKAAPSGLSGPPPPARREPGRTACAALSESATWEPARLGRGRTSVFIPKARDIFTAKSTPLSTRRCFFFRSSGRLRILVPGGIGGNLRWFPVLTRSQRELGRRHAVPRVGSFASRSYARRPRLGSLR